MTAVLALSSCTPKELVNATIHYGDAGAALSTEVLAASSIVTPLCRRRAELEFLTYRSVPSRKLLGFSDYYTKHAAPSTLTWQQTCDAYNVAERTFAHALTALGEYSRALVTFASDDADLKTDLEAAAKSAAKGAAAISSAASVYKSTLEGVGAPLGTIANAVKAKWKARHLGRLVAKADPHLQTVVSRLRDYIEAIKTAQIADLRAAATIVLLQLESARMINDEAIDVFSGAMLDVLVTRTLQHAERRLARLETALDQFATAHRELRQGWQTGRSAGPATLRRMRELAAEMTASAMAFRTEGIE